MARIRFGIRTTNRCKGAQLAFATLQLVADALLCGRRVTVDPFVE